MMDSLGTGIRVEDVTQYVGRPLFVATYLPAPDMFWTKGVSRDEALRRLSERLSGFGIRVDQLAVEDVTATIDNETTAVLPPELRGKQWPEDVDTCDRSK